MKRDWIKKVKNNTVVNGIVRLGIGTVLAIVKVCIPVNEKKYYLSPLMGFAMMTARVCCMRR